MGSVNKEIGFITKEVEELNLTYEKDKTQPEEPTETTEQVETQTTEHVEAQTTEQVETQTTEQLETQATDQVETQVEKNLESEFLDENFYNDSPIDKLVINLGSSDLPRICCANHKLNLAVRYAMVQHKTICDDMKKVNQFVCGIKKSIMESRIFKDLNCRLRLENKTRWGVVFLVLEALKKAYDKGAFTDAESPIPIELVSIYLEILKPAYIFNLTLQSHQSSIADLIPGINNLIYTWQNMETTSSGNQLCRLLIKSIKSRFEYELNSSYYKVFI